MIWKKSKQPADSQQDAAAAPKKGGAAAFAKKNWKWLVPVACVAVFPVCGAPAAFCSVFFFIDPPKNEQAALPPAGIRFTVQLIVV